MGPRNLTEQQGDAQLSAFFDIQMHYGCAAASLLISFRTLRILFIKKNKIKSALKGHHFESTEDIQRSVMQVLNDILQNAFQKYYKQWQHRWKRCVKAKGVYFEGDHTVVDE
jgi:hypothetical protein